MNNFAAVLSILFANFSENIHSCVLPPFFIQFLIGACRSRGMSHDSKSNLPGDSGEYNASGKKPRVRTSYKVVFAEKYYGDVRVIDKTF